MAPNKEADCLTEHLRAEDILLGSLGYGEEARLITIERSSSGYRGLGRFSDGEEFEFEWSDGVDQLQEWALGIVDKYLGA